MSYRPLDLSDRLPFGAHKGKTVREVLTRHPEYLEWLRRNTETRFAPSVTAELDRENERRSHPVNAQKYSEREMGWRDE